MKKDQAIKVSAVGILYVLAGVILSYTVSLELRPEHPANNFIRVQWALIFIAVLTAATVIAWKSTTCNQIRHALMKSYTCGLLLYYLFAVLGLLFFSKDLAHFHQIADQEEYMERYVTLIPFETYQQMFSQYESDVLALRDSVILFAGRFAAFLPLGIFLLVLIRALRHFWRYTLVLSGIIILVEILQFSFYLGSVTLDGIVLNVLGAEFAYLTFWNPLVQKFLRKYDFIET